MKSNSYSKLIQKATSIEKSYGHGAFGETEVYHDNVIDYDKLIDLVYHECLEIVNENLREVRLDSDNKAPTELVRSALSKVKSDIIKRIELK